MDTGATGQDGQERRPVVIVHTPLDADQKILIRLLTEENLETLRSSNVQQLGDNLAAGELDCIVASQEGLTNGSLKLLKAVLAEQPTWSELPIVLLVDDPFQSQEIGPWLHAKLPRSKLCILQRPVRRTEFASIIRSLVSGRKHQFSVRDHMVFQEELRLELNHRIKNILTTAISLFELSRRNTDDIAALTEDYRGRLTALSQVHAALYEASTDHVSVKTLIDSSFEPFAADDRLAIIGDDLVVDAPTAETLALALHELVTNALKYGALSVPGGYVRTELSTEEGPGRGLIRWRESGGPPVAEPKAKGYGTRFIKSGLNARGGRAELRFAATGLEADLEISIAQPD